MTHDEAIEYANKRLHAWRRNDPERIPKELRAMRALIAYAAECVALERERCAKVAENWGPPLTGDPMQDHLPVDSDVMSVGIAAAIRAG
jgi:hypothetical protein